MISLLILVSAGAAAQPDNAFEDLSRLESNLQALLAVPGYAEAFYKVLDKPFLNLAKPGLADEVNASARVQAVLVRYAERTMELQFFEVAGNPRAMTAKRYGNRIVVNTAWLKIATDDDLHAVLAHEVSHDGNDCIRFWLIEQSAATKRQKENARNEIEMRVDARAIDLLRRERRSPTALPDILSRYLPPGSVSNARIAAAKRIAKLR